MTKQLLQDLVFRYLESKGREVERFTNNRPGIDWVNSFMSRHKLVLRQACNIKRNRASLRSETVNEFFSELFNCGLSNASPCHVFNYDETGLSDNPGSQKVIAKRGTRRIEIVQEHSKTNISVMFCGSAEGKLLPPTSYTRLETFTRLEHTAHHVVLGSTARRVDGLIKKLLQLGFAIFSYLQFQTYKDKSS